MLFLLKLTRPAIHTDKSVFSGLQPLPYCLAFAATRFADPRLSFASSCTSHGLEMNASSRSGIVPSPHNNTVIP